MRIVCGCGASFKRSGFQSHQQQSDDPLCRLASESKEKNLSGTAQSKSTKATTQNATVETTHESFEMEVDSVGDYFGNYADYSLAELGLDDDEGFVNHLAPVDEDDDEAGEFEEASVEEEHSLEPPRSNCGQSIDQDDSSPDGGAMRLRGGAEIQLQKEPYIVKFMKGKAGAVYSQDGIDLNTEYTTSLGESDNPYRPFISKMEWEIASWAKTRGPSSTAFTELMKIEGVSSGCY